LKRSGLVPDAHPARRARVPAQAGPLLHPGQHPELGDARAEDLGLQGQLPHALRLRGDVAQAAPWVFSLRSPAVISLMKGSRREPVPGRRNQPAVRELPAHPGPGRAGPREHLQPAHRRHAQDDPQRQVAVL